MEISLAYETYLTGVLNFKAYPYFGGESWEVLIPNDVVKSVEEWAEAIDNQITDLLQAFLKKSERPTERKITLTTEELKNGLTLNLTTMPKQTMYTYLSDASFDWLQRTFSQLSNELYIPDSYLAEALDYIPALIEKGNREAIIALTNVILDYKKKETNENTPPALNNTSPPLNLYRLLSTHTSFGGQAKAMQGYVLAETEEQVYEHIAKTYSTNWKDREEDEADGKFKAKILSLKGEINDKDYDFSNSKYGVNLYGWELVQTGVKENYTKLIKLGVILRLC
jgi:hypothetical protein